MTQGQINGQVTKLANQPEKLKQFMADKSDEEKRQARCHLKTVLALRKKK
jgi:hypothetical protein